MNQIEKREVLQQVIELKQALVDLREWEKAAKLRDLQRELELTPYEEELSFPARFKVGDNIRANSWDSHTYETIVHIDTYGFATKDSDGYVYSYEFNDLEWEQYEVCDPEEKELSNMVKCYHIIRIQGSDVIWKLSPVFFSESFVETMDRNNFVTEKEALEKGLIL